MGMLAYKENADGEHNALRLNIRSIKTIYFSKQMTFKKNL